MFLKSVKCALLGSAVFFAAGPVWGQTASAPDASSSETVVVTGSRITLSGYQQPTPVLAIGAEDLARDANTNLGDVFRQLPSFAVASSPNTTTNIQNISGGTAGTDEVDLRNLGVLRTLILFNGNRVVPTAASGGVDLSVLPSSLIKRIDVVTGGAGAVWGSDAIAGVVNIIMNNDLDGLKANVEGQINGWGNSEHGKVDVAYGTSFLGDRGHFVLGATYYITPRSTYPSDTPWDNSAILANNPAYTATNGQPQYIRATGAGYSQFTQGGLINSGPLKGIQFVGSAGTPTVFNFGNVTGPTSVGGSALVANTQGEENQLNIPQVSLSLYGHASYKIFDNVTASAEFELGQVRTRNNSFSFMNTNTIKIDNAYLPASIAALMNTNHVTTIPVGTLNTNNIGNGSDTNTGALDEVGKLQNVIYRTMQRGVVSLDGVNSLFGSQWSWNLTNQNSTSHNSPQSYVPIVGNYNNAVDAVAVTAANVGASGLPVGSIACRSTLTNPTNGCAPLDILGNGVASQSAINYIYTKPGQDRASILLNEETFSASIQGEPLSLWAGPVAVALGYDYRKEAVRQTADAGSYARLYAAGNIQPLGAEYNTNEGFLEINAPLLRDQLVQSLDLDTAGRLVSYSTFGEVETWKLGLTSQVNDDVKLRLSWSNDIRAPSLTDLYNPGQTTFGSVTVPGIPGNVNALNGGNANLKPEVAHTVTGGVVLTPTFIPGLILSADWYSILINKVIYTPTTQQVVQGCLAGQAVYCANFIYVNGVLNFVASIPVNGASQTSSGIDFQADYSQDLFSGKMSLHLVGNYTDEAVLTQQGSPTIKYDIAGAVGSDTVAGTQAANGYPKLRATVAATYADGPYSATVQSRIIGSAVLNNYWGASGPNSVSDNSVPAVAYLDLRGSYIIDEHAQLYAAVDNLMDIPPPSVPVLLGFLNNPAYAVPTRSDIYDTLGRMFRVGVRLSY